ncbi:MAG: T9SS type A sorting domain-containing protein [Bacteroidetes bacterium]|nr:MAG: T9SS type A sorting domain-containing protein [Bacteroidota bacterium]
MLRAASFAVLMAGLLSLAAYQSGDPISLERPFPVNNTLAHIFLDWETTPVLPKDVVECSRSADSVQGVNVLMLNYSAYDSAYAGKVKDLIQKRLPGVLITEFWKGSGKDLTAALNGQSVVVVTYPATGSTGQIRAYGRVLANYVQKGGAVVFSGTDQFGMLQQYGLFDLDFGYFCTDLALHTKAPEHPILQDIPADFALQNYAYPLDVADPNFVVLSEVRGYPALGYKSMGAGKIVYIGLEYYYDEPVSTRILENTLRWLAPSETQVPAPVQPEANLTWANRSANRTEERLFAGSGKPALESTFDLKIYPNPYFEKATLDVNLETTAPVSVEMTDESGVTVAVLLPFRVLNEGLYRFDLPNVPSGVYFVKCQAGPQTTVRKVVKVAAQ